MKLTRATLDLFGDHKIVNRMNFWPEFVVFQFSDGFDSVFTYTQK